MNGKAWSGSAVLLAAALAAACTTMGVGTGTSRGGGAPVDFAWTSEGSVSGTMTAKLESTGETFSGQYFQVTSQTVADELAPLWYGWHGRWAGWPYWGPDGGSTFVTHYSGKVLANLSTPTGEYMRCNFRLASPPSGMSGGGLGKCQLSEGNTIDATFPAA